MSICFSDSVFLFIFYSFYFIYLGFDSFFVLFLKTVGNIINGENNVKQQNSVTSICRLHRPHHFVSEWCMLKWSREKEKMCLFAVLLSAERCPLYLAVFYTSGPVTKSSWLYIRHTQEEAGSFVQLVSRFLDATNRSRFWVTVLLCHYLYSFLLWYLTFLFSSTNTFF